MAKANKLVPVVDGTAGTPIELQDSRIYTNSPTGGDLLVYNATNTRFEAEPLNALVSTFKVKANNNTVSTFTVSDNLETAVNFLPGTGINLTGNSTQSTITISAESHHDVLSKNEIVRAANGSKLYYYNVRCNLNGNELKVVDISDVIPTSGAYTYTNNYVWEKQESETGKYLGICKIQSTEGKYVFKMDIYDAAKNVTITHYFCLLVDTPDDATFTFVTTCDWEISVRLIPNNNRLLAFMKFPDNFVGTATLIPLRKSIRTGVDQMCSFDYSSGTTIREYPWATQLQEDSQELNTLTDLTGYEPVTDDPQNTTYYLRVPAGNYYVNIIGDFGGILTTGSKISDTLVNDYYLHTLEKRVEIIQKENANVQANWNESDSTDPAFIKNKPSIPSNTSDLTNDSGFITASDISQDVFVCNFTFNSGSNVYGSMDKTPQQISSAVASGNAIVCKAYNDILYFVSNAALTFNRVLTTGSVTIYYDGSNWVYNISYLQPQLIASGNNQNIKTINGNSLLGSGDLAVQSDWDETDSNSSAYILNKPTIDTQLSETSTNLVQNKAINVLTRKLWRGVDIISRLGSEYPAANKQISSGSWSSSSGSAYKHWAVPVDGMRAVSVTANSSQYAIITFLKTYNSTTGTPDFATGYTGNTTVKADQTRILNVPSDANWLIVMTGNNGVRKPDHIYLTGVAANHPPLTYIQLASGATTYDISLTDTKQSFIIDNPNVRSVPINMTNQFDNIYSNEDIALDQNLVAQFDFEFVESEQKTYLFVKQTPMYDRT